MSLAQCNWRRLIDGVEIQGLQRSFGGKVGGCSTSIAVQVLRATVLVRGSWRSATRQGALIEDVYTRCWKLFPDRSPDEKSSRYPESIRGRAVGTRLILIRWRKSRVCLRVVTRPTDVTCMMRICRAVATNKMLKRAKARDSHQPFPALDGENAPLHRRWYSHHRLEMDAVSARGELDTSKVLESSSIYVPRTSEGRKRVRAAPLCLFSHVGDNSWHTSLASLIYDEQIEALS